MSETPRLRIGTRGSPLALAQTREVRARLAAAHPELAPEGAIEVVIIKTTGDKVLDRVLAEIGGKGLFTKEIDEALLDQRIDLAVHSMKDVPTWLPDGLVMGAILPREDPRDVLFLRDAASLDELDQGAVVGTASLRRAAQIKAARPDLVVVPFRGNVGTRLRKLAAGEVDATLLALAGLKRLGTDIKDGVILGLAEMLPAVGQGAIGLQLRADDDATAASIAALDDPETACRVAAERACLEVLDGSCRTPIAAHARLDESGDELNLEALVALPDGSELHRIARSGPRESAAALGRAAGEALKTAAGAEFLARLAAE